MQLTEDQAKERWCPFGRVKQVKPKEFGGEGDTPVAANRRMSPPGGDRSVWTQVGSTPCLASGCMAWRWAAPNHVERIHRMHGCTYEGLKGLRKAQPSVPWMVDDGDGGLDLVQAIAMIEAGDLPGTAVWTAFQTRKVEGRGYCGLVGKGETE